MTRLSDVERTIAIGFAVTIAYILTAQLGFRFAFISDQVTTVWAPTGIAQAALLIWGRGLWPAVWLGAFVANATTDAPLWTALFIATGNTLEALVPAVILPRFLGFDPSLRRTRDGLAFIVVAAGLSTTISATIGVLTLSIAGVEPWSRFAELWLAWWVGDVLGSLVIGPAILTMARAPFQRSGAYWTETGLLVAATGFVTHFVFNQVLGPGSGHHPLEYIIVPFVITAAVRLGLPATALVVFVASVVKIGNTLRGVGPFATTEINESMLLLQVFTGVLAGTGLLLATAIAERLTGERRRAAAHAVGDVLAESTTLLDAAPSLLRAIGENLGWPVGALWIVEDDRQRITCVSVWSEPRPAVNEFLRITQEFGFAAGVGLPGRVWSTGRPIWIEDVVHDPNFPRLGYARAAGLHGAFGCPIRVENEVVGVIEFFNPGIAHPDRDLLATMSTVGNQIGQFEARKRVEVEVRRAEQERERLLQRELTARRDAEAANRAKDEFLATLSHELRTPLNAIVGWTRMLLDGSLDEHSATRALQVIDRNANLQAQLIEDILDVSRIITGVLRVDRKPVDLGSVIGAVYDAVRPAAEAKRIRIQSRLDGSARLTEGDPQRLQQVVWNLLSNAVKFTRPGGLVEIELVAAGPNGVRILVRDDGAGIAPEFLPYVFDRFRQADGSISRQHGGLGLGLAIVRHLVELHGGTVRAESDGLDRGSTFIIELPRLDAASLSPSQDGRSASADGQPLTGCRALIVDDEEDARTLLRTILVQAGAAVETAASVAEALQFLDASPTDVLLADLGMAGEDGYALIREVRRRDERGGTHLPAAAITAYAGPQFRDRALAAGFDCHVPKPIVPGDFVRMVAGLRDGDVKV
jgi:signal transduction histidine kinase/integral membrane sensor domain MASE1/CheY-like chemotaxis protein